jgi:uncharacterized protein YciI
MWYAIICDEIEDSLDKRMAARPAHLERLRSLVEEGRVLAAGPHPAIDNEEPGDAGFDGSLLILDFPDIQAAMEWAKADPYVHAGVFSNVTVKPFKKVFP